MNFRKGNERYYYVSKIVLWALLGMMIVWIGICFCKQDLYKVWLVSSRREKVTYASVSSVLSDDTKCYLCGNTDDSMMPYYRKFDTLGILFLNDWNILGFETHSGTRISIGNTEEYRYENSSVPGKGLAEINVTFEEGYKPDIESLRKRLCQTCLDKVLEALEFERLKNQKKEAMPLCLVDFRTLEIYSVQKPMQKLYLDNWYVSTQGEDNKFKIEIRGTTRRSIKKGRGSNSKSRDKT